MTNPASRLARNYEVEPILAGKLVCTGNDFHGIPIHQHLPQWDHLSIHPGPGTFIAHFTMDRVGEIDGTCSPGEIDHFATRSEYEDLVGKEIHLDGIQKLVRVR